MSSRTYVKKNELTPIQLARLNRMVARVREAIVEGIQDEDRGESLGAFVEKHKWRDRVMEQFHFMDTSRKGRRYVSDVTSRLAEEMNCYALTGGTPKYPNTDV